MRVKTLEELYVDELRDLYSAENQLVKALPKMAKAATNPELSKAVQAHLEMTKEHVKRLKVIFEQLDEKPSGKECVAMKGLLEEGDEIVESVESGPVLDVAIIGAAQKVEHYEIAGYGTARTIAGLLGHSKHAELLDRTCDEEGTTDQELTKLANNLVNVKAQKQKMSAKT